MNNLTDDVVAYTNVTQWPPGESINYNKLTAIQLAIDLAKSGRLEEEGIIPAAEAIYEFIKN